MLQCPAKNPYIYSYFYKHVIFSIFLYFPLFLLLFDKRLTFIINEHVHLNLIAFPLSHLNKSKIFIWINQSVSQSIESDFLSANRNPNQLYLKYTMRRNECVIRLYHFHRIFNTFYCTADSFIVLRAWAWVFEQQNNRLPFRFLSCIIYIIRSIRTYLSTFYLFIFLSSFLFVGVVNSLYSNWKSAIFNDFCCYCCWFGSKVSNKKKCEKTHSCSFPFTLTLSLSFSFCVANKNE